MTKIEFLTAVSTNSITEEVIEKAIELLDKEHEKNADNVAKKARENAPIIKAIHKVLANANSPMTASAIATAVSNDLGSAISISKVSALLGKMDGITKTAIKVVGEPLKQGYSLVE